MFNFFNLIEASVGQRLPWVKHPDVFILLMSCWAVALAVSLIADAISTDFVIITYNQYLTSNRPDR